MTLTYATAVDAIFGRFNQDWTDGRVSSLLGYAPQTLWEGKEKATGLDTKRCWARVSQRTVLERQDSLSACVGDATKRRYLTAGLVFVQIFCPKSVSNSIELGRALATIARGAFRGKYAGDDQIVFYRARINELEPELEFYRFNVVADYEYNEIG